MRESSRELDTERIELLKAFVATVVNPTFEGAIKGQISSYDPPSCYGQSHTGQQLYNPSFKPYSLGNACAVNDTLEHNLSPH